MVKYAAGEKIALVGVPDQMIKTIAQQFVHQNMGAIRADEADYTAAINITQRTAGGTIAQQVAKVEELREAALKGKSRDEAAQIGKSYDLAVSFFRVLDEMKRAQNSQTSTYTFPSLQQEFSPSVINGWRDQNQRVYAEHKHNQAEQQKTAARDAMAPIYAAIDELPVSQQGAIRTILTNAHSDAKQNGVTGSENIMRNMQATLEGKGKTAWLGLSKTDAGIAADVIERAQEIAAARGNPDIFLKGTQLKAQQAEAAKAAATLLYGTKNTRYGQTVDISTPEQARNTARVVVLSATFGKGGHFNSARVNELLSDAPSPPYANGALRTLHDQMAAATNQDEKNSIQAVISVLTLENQFAADRAAGKKSWNIFANNNALMDFHRKSLTAAGSFAADDQTVAVAPAAGGQTNGGAGTPTRTGVPVYGRKDGTPAPNPDEVPALADEAQVRALQEKLGVKVDGMYGPETHAAMLAAAKKENKQAKDYDFTVEGALNAFFTFLAGLVGGAGTTTDAPDANLNQLKATLTQIASGLVDDNGNKPTADASDIRVANPAAAVFKPDDLKVKVAEDIVAKLKKAGVTDETVLATIAGTVTVDSSYRVHSKFIDTLEELSGFSDHNDTLDGRSAMLLDNSDTGKGKESMAALASAINNGSIKVVASAGAPSVTPGAANGSQAAGR